MNGQMTSKACSKCHQVKSLSDFYKRAGGKDGHYTWCIDCEKIKKRIYYESHQELIKVKWQDLYSRLKCDILAKNELYRKANRVKVRAKRNLREKERMKTDINFRIRRYMRTRVREALGCRRHSSVVLLLGCSVQDLRTKFESMFRCGMTWDNYGEWHIDHIRPLASFDLSNEEQLKCAFHHSNLQPLWALDNMIKSDKWPEVSSGS